MAPTLTSPTKTGGRTLLRLATAGSVDDGKSTLVGRLLYDTNSVLTDTLDHVQQVSKRKGLATADLALLTDGLRAEREQGITIDVAYRYFATPARKFILADCPGHVQYTRNTVTGSSTADVILLLVDARNGVVEQTRRHLAVASLLRVPHVVLAVNKIDLVDYSEARFTEIATEFAMLARSLNVPDSHCIPVSATEGDNVAVRSARMPWYDGPTVLGYLEELPTDHRVTQADFRFPVQRVVHPQGASGTSPWLASRPTVDRGYRGYAGRIQDGRVAVGDEVTAMPRGGRTRVTGIDTPDGPLQAAVKGQSVILRLATDIDLSRGDLLAAPDHPPAPRREVDATICWLADRHLTANDWVLVQHGTALTRARVITVLDRIDLARITDDGPTWAPTDRLDLNDIGRAQLTLATPLPIDRYAQHRATGAFIIIDPHDGRTLGAGMAT